jgi:S1/P1 Nuclease
MIFASGISRITRGRGTLSTGPLNRRATHQVQVREPEPVNILTGLPENVSVVRSQNEIERKAIALAWLFHLVGDLHQPLHTAQLFTVEYPRGDRGGNEICVCVTQAGQPIDLHRFWDGVIISSSNGHPATKRGHGAQKPPRVSAEPAHRTWEHWL